MFHSNIAEIFTQAYQRDKYLKIINQQFNFEELSRAYSIDHDGLKELNQLGIITTKDNKKLGVFEAYIKPNTKLQRNRVALRNIIVQQTKSTARDGAFAVYIDTSNKQWRFSFIAIEPVFDSDNKVILKETASKRFTYLLGEGTKTRTALDQFSKLNKGSTLQHIKSAFAVEPLNKEFYDELYKWYEDAQTKVTFPNDEEAKQHTEISLIRLLTRLLFVWFIKQKCLINDDLFTEARLKEIIHYDQPSSYYKAILQNLFFATLNREIKERSFRTTTKNRANSNNYLVTNLYRYQNYFQSQDKDHIINLFTQTPFLNGGLFECLDRDREPTDEEKQAYDNDKTIRKEKTAIRIDGFSDRPDNILNVPNELFFNEDETNKDKTGLINLLDRYQFTVEENTPLDIEVALDPELLGRTFENLLASYNPETGQQARKASGSFYTPREIVSYMVDESLKQYLQQSLGTDSKDKIAKLFNGDVNELSSKDKITLIEAIDNIRILDPAVGSGAFPMGILHRLVDLLKCLDPNNEEYKKRQLEKIHEMDDNKSREQALNAIEEVFSQENAHNNYGRKLYLIENCIYGVDIQPIAIQIAKLRFFISLVIEQEATQDKTSNYGIRALPNLETKFIVANSLLKLANITQLDLFDDDIKHLRKKLEKTRHKYFNAKTLATKRKHREKDEEIRKKIEKELNARGVTEEIKADAHKIAQWDPYKPDVSADWFDAKWMFGIDDGFDVVIGNPPYIKTEHLTEETKTSLKQNFRDEKNKGWVNDLYVHFTFKAFECCKKDGMVLLITNDSFVGFKTKKRVRDLLYANNLMALIKCPYETFNASIYTAIFIAQKAISGDKYKTFEFIHPSYEIENLGDVELNTTKTLPHKRLVYPSIEFEIYKTLSTNAKLSHYVSVLDTGIDSGNVRYKLFFKEHKPNLNRLLQGKHIDKYKLQWQDVNQGYKFCNPDYVPQNKKGIGRGGKPSKKNEYWNFRGDESNHQLLERLLLRQTDDDLVATYHNEELHGQFYTDNTLHTIIPKASTINLKFVLALLNSKLLNFLYHFLSQEEGRTMAQVKIGIVEQLPIPKITLDQQQPFIKLVDQILTAKETDTTKLETEIDKLVYNLYNLTDEEIAIVEK